MNAQHIDGVHLIGAIHSLLPVAPRRRMKRGLSARCVAKLIVVGLSAIEMVGCATAAVIDRSRHRDSFVSRSIKSKSITVMKNDVGYYLVIDSGQWGWGKDYLVPVADSDVEQYLNGIPCPTNHLSADPGKMGASMGYGSFSLTSPSGASRWVVTKTKPCGGEPVLVLTDVPINYTYVSGAKVIAIRCEHAVLLPLALAVDVVALPIEIAGLTFFILTWHYP